MIIKANREGLLFHPLNPHLPCPVLQYADDTLILVKATPEAAQHLKLILDSFADATGLQINFSKTTFIPLNVNPSDATSMASDLATDVSSFPQTYLGLPLSPHKLPPSAFQPVIDRCDTYLSGWCALLLSRGGKLVLLSAVLNSLPTYFMLCFSLPIQVLEAIDKRRRTFFWSNDETCSGAKCLVAWDKVCTPRDAGGLGVKKLTCTKFLSTAEICL